MLVMLVLNVPSGTVMRLVVDCVGCFERYLVGVMVLNVRNATVMKLVVDRVVSTLR